MYNAIIVARTPNKAAMHPGWPETLISIGTSIFALFQLARGVRKADWERNYNSFSNGLYDDEQPQPRPTKLSAFSSVVPPAIQAISWTISFRSMQADKAGSGWISALHWTVTALTVMWAIRFQVASVSVTFAILSLFQFIGSGVVIGQRWKGTIGTAAYEITDSKGCIPFNDFSYLEQGARSRAFRILQTVEFVYSVSVLTNLYYVRRQQTDQPESDGMFIKGIVKGTLMLIYIPVLIYEAIIASKGMPVVISGNCMLVELDPKWGFFDSEIETWWKALAGIVGM